MKLTLLRLELRSDLDQCAQMLLSEECLRLKHCEVPDTPIEISINED